MFLKENILLAIAGLRANKMRALLTMLGIIIGISSVIAIVSVGNSLTASLKETMSKMGANNITVYIRGKDSGGFMNGGARPDPTENDLITMDQINELRDKIINRIDDVEVSDYSLGNGKAKDGRLYANVSIIGVNTGYKNIENVKMISGRFLNDNDVKGIKKITVVSDKFAKQMFKNEDPLGKEVKVYAGDYIYTYIVAGVYKYEPFAFSRSMGSDKDIQTNLYVPITVAKASAKLKNYEYFVIKAKSNAENPKIIKDVKTYFDKLYAKNPNWEIGAESNEGMISEVTSMMSKLKIAISVIAAISLLVGGIGVMNIMLVAVTERTREIGTRKALGARSSHIKLQFIVEAMIICGIGGVIGVTLGIVIGMLGAVALKAPISISIPIIIISVTFSMVIGVFFGYYPANKAAKLDPIEALRYE